MSYRQNQCIVSIHMHHSQIFQNENNFAGLWKSANAITNKNENRSIVITKKNTKDSIKQKNTSDIANE